MNGISSPLVTHFLETDNAINNEQQEKANRRKQGALLTDC